MGATLDALGESPGFLLSRVGTAVQAGFKQTLAGWQLRPLHFLVLSTLGEMAGVSQRELCGALRIDSGNMVQLLDHLEQLELARRSPHPQDRRRHVVTITEAGRETLAAVAGATRALDERFLAPLSEAERRQLVKLLAKLYASTAEGRREAPPLGTPSPAGGER